MSVAANEGDLMRIETIEQQTIFVNKITQERNREREWASGECEQTPKVPENKYIPMVCARTNSGQMDYEWITERFLREKQKAAQAQINEYWLFNPHNSLASTFGTPQFHRSPRHHPRRRRRVPRASGTSSAGAWCVCVPRTSKPSIEITSIENKFVQFQYVLNKYGAHEVTK